MTQPGQVAKNATLRPSVGTQPRNRNPAKGQGFEMTFLHSFPLKEILSMYKINDSQYEKSFLRYSLTHSFDFFHTNNSCTNHVNTHK